METGQSCPITSIPGGYLTLDLCLMEDTMKITAALLTASLVLGSAGVALASEAFPQEDLDAGNAALNQLPFGSQARTEADTLLTEAKQAYNHHNAYEAYTLAHQARQIEQQAMM
jgi:hypothetical protein